MSRRTAVLSILAVLVLLVVVIPTAVSALHIVANHGGAVFDPAVDPGALVVKGHPIVDNKEHDDVINDLSSMSRAQLKRFLHDRDVRCVGCMDKESLIETAVSSAHLPTHTDNLIGELTPLQVGEVNLIADYLEKRVTAVTMPTQEVVQQQQQQAATGAAFEITCSTPGANGTVVCYSAAAVRQHAQKSAQF